MQFCEDIREEKQGTLSIIGVLPDNINVAQVPFGLAKLAFYLRISFDPSIDIGAISNKLVFPDGHQISLGEVSADLIERSKREAIERGSPIAGIVIQAGFVSVQIAKEGRIRALTTIGSDSFVAGTVNITSQQQS
jgi:Family of unknown function (DUF6941)